MQRRLLLGLVAALAIYLGLTTAFGLEQVGSSLRALPWIWWLVGPAICLSSHLLLLGRWQFYLHWLGYPLPLKAGARIYAAGLALIAAPGRSGEALRGLWLQRRHDFPLTVGVGITLAERLADLASALLVLSWGLGRQVWSAALVGGVVLGAGGWLLTHPRVLQRLERGLERLPMHRRWQGLIRLLREALLAMGRMRTLMKPKPLLVGTLLACLLAAGGGPAGGSLRRLGGGHRLAPCGGDSDRHRLGGCGVAAAGGPRHQRSHGHRPGDALRRRALPGVGGHPGAAVVHPGVALPDRRGGPDASAGFEPAQRCREHWAPKRCPRRAQLMLALRGLSPGPLWRGTD